MIINYNNYLNQHLYFNTEMANVNKRKVSLNENHKKEFPHIIPADDPENVDHSKFKCTICRQIFYHSK